MQEEFVTYEIAKKLKELGFDKKCLYYFDSFGSLGSSNAFWHNYNESELLVSKPLWQQAIDWLRVNHNISLGVYPCFVFENHYNYEIIINRDFDNMLVSNNSNVLTYENARELGILKAIELCKKNS